MTEATCIVISFDWRLNCFKYGRYTVGVAFVVTLVADTGGDSVVNTYGGSPLNRLSWLRTSQVFLNRIIGHPDSRWMLFNAGQPIAVSSGTVFSLFVTTDDVKQLLGPEPYFGQGQHPGEALEDADDSDEHSDRHSPTKASRHLGPRIVFLGLHETEKDANSALPLPELKDPDTAIQKLKGTLYFALDIAEVSGRMRPEEVQKTLEDALSKDGRSFKWSEPRALMAQVDGFTAAVFASARSMVDWNLRNKFCPGCGDPTYSMWGGWKISCTSLLPWANNSGRPPCPSGKGLQNYTHPRTDAVVIMIAIDETGDQVLLGRGRRWPGKFYSALAGFIEPGEALEDAVMREMWEEAGVEVWNVRYHSGQPWAYPANLMLGFYARADAFKPIRTDLDNELIDARWFSRDEVRAILGHHAGTKMEKSDYKKMNELVDGKPVESSTDTTTARVSASDQDSKATTARDNQGVAIADDEPPFRLPPDSAIAGVLIRDWADGKIGFFDQGAQLRNNL
ncbi:NAD+ diphosphatase [Coprinopsis sp. MPI-PUGE-AT-0042]|nr:NAD+ diphosphatase [Coprinopsis sp. MPI-PUGE-AT-0042]